MSVALLLGVAVLGGVGSVGRVLLDELVSRRADSYFPVGTLVVNLTGSFALGVLVGAGAGPDALRLAGLGLVAGYSTFSTWMLDSHRLAQDGRGRVAAANLAVSLIVGLGAAWLGRELGLAL